MKMMFKVMRAYNVAIWNRLSKEQKEAFAEYNHHPLFNYAKNYSADWVDPNTDLIVDFMTPDEDK